MEITIAHKSICAILTLIIILLIFQFAYAQTIEEEIIKNTLETVEKATAGTSEITAIINNMSTLSYENTTTTFSNSEQMKNITANNKQNLTYSTYENNKMGIKVKYPSIGEAYDYTFDTNIV